MSELSVPPVLRKSNSSAVFARSMRPSCSIEQEEAEADQRVSRVLILYTGGTIGMHMGETGYTPKADYLSEMLSKMHMFQVPSALPRRVIPPSNLPGEVEYEIIEYIPLLDSSNMGERDWIKIAADIEANYERFDSFIVLHGTDTMAYTASALSFMLENLGKTVILTGSQIPLAELRNDAIDNLLGALLIAGHFVIPEVCLFFNNKLFRGNRTRKTNASGLKAFSSPNCRPLATVGVEIQVNWGLVRPLPDEPFRVSKTLSDRVGTLRLFPGIPHQIIRNFLLPPLQGLVLETYGAGNGPDTRELFLDALRQGSEEHHVVIVNITQCGKGRVVDSYACGQALKRVGVVGGEDMTSEAALTKLMYLLGRTDLTIDQVRQLIKMDMRGELTMADPQPIFSFQNKKFIHAVAAALGDGLSGVHDAGPSPHRDLVLSGITQALNPVLLCFTAATSDMVALRQLLAAGADLNSADYDGRTPLHMAAASGHANVVQFLLHKGAAVDPRDRSGLTPYDWAVQTGHLHIVDLLSKHGARPSGVKSPIRAMPLSTGRETTLYDSSTPVQPSTTSSSSSSSFQ